MLRLFLQPWLLQAAITCFSLHGARWDTPSCPVNLSPSSLCFGMLPGAHHFYCWAWAAVAGLANAVLWGYWRKRCALILLHCWAAELHLSDGTSADWCVVKKAVSRKREKRFLVHWPSSLVRNTLHWHCLQMNAENIGKCVMT